MFDLKKKALGSIKESLGKGMAEEINPKPAPQPEGEEPVGMEDEMPGMEGSEISDKIPGADVSKLTPEEQQQLDALLDKMGC